MVASGRGRRRLRPSDDGSSVASREFSTVTARREPDFRHGLLSVHAAAERLSLQSRVLSVGKNAPAVLVWSRVCSRCCDFDDARGLGLGGLVAASKALTV